jgi:hypothetical protein
MSVAPSASQSRRLDLTVLLVSLGIILLEINHTRIFSTSSSTISRT